MLQFCVSQQYNDSVFFTFRSTGIRVYSLEEALYHVFHYWRESMDDFLSEGIIVWVSELGLSDISAKIKEIASAKHLNSSKQILDFLQLIEYFDAAQLNSLQATLEAWEHRCEWEKLKERADHLVKRGEPSKALLLYKRALQLEENVALLNNIGVVYMQLSAPEDAVNHLARACAIAPGNVSVLLHYIEATILNKEYVSAEQALSTVEQLAPDRAEIPFLHGLMAYGQKNYAKALTYYEKAIKLDQTTPYYIYKMADVHKTVRQYKKALDILMTVPYKDSNYYVKEAEIHAAAGDISEALRCMRSATSADGRNDANLWAKLAEYYRHDYDWQMAEKAISYALNLAPDNDKVRLESARIKKGLGRTRDYQAELADILKDLKERYRTDG